jgi:Predicted solute binding protein
MSLNYRGYTCPSRAAVIALLCCAAALLLPGALAADEYYTGYLGDTIDLHGYSYGGGSQVYLFMTGPGLPTNGVTLTDTGQRADQGQFTIVPLDSHQQWSMKWDTSRIWNDIDPGTYLVYVTMEPVDYAHLGGSNSYKTLSVYLKDDSSRTGSSSVSYTLNPELHSSTATATSATPLPSAKVSAPTVPTTPAQEPTAAAPPTNPLTTARAAATTKAPLPGLLSVLSLLVVAGILLSRPSRRG